MANEPGGDFTVNDTTGAASTDLNTLFGVNVNVGQAPVLLSGTTNPQLRKTLQQHGEDVTTKPSTLTEVLQGFYGMDADALAQLQQQLYSGGFYDSSYYTGKTPNQPTLGIPDEDSYAAFKKAVVRAARSGTALPDVLDQSAASFSRTQAANAAQAQPIQLTNADDLRATFTGVVKQRTGKNPDPALVQRMIDAFHKSEVDAQTAQYAAAANGGQYTAPPNATAFATEQIGQLDPTGVGTETALNVMDTFMGMLKASG